MSDVWLVRHAIKISVTCTEEREEGSGFLVLKTLSATLNNSALFCCYCKIFLIPESSYVFWLQ